VQLVVRPTAIEVGLEPAADDQAHVLIDRHVSAVEQPMEIVAKRQAVAHLVLAALGVRSAHAR